MTLTSFLSYELRQGNRHSHIVPDPFLANIKEQILPPTPMGKRLAPSFRLESVREDVDPKTYAK